MWGTPWVLVILSIVHKKNQISLGPRKQLLPIFQMRKLRLRKIINCPKPQGTGGALPPILVFHFESEEWPFWFKTSKASVIVCIPAPGQERGKGDDLDFWCRPLNRQELVNSNLLLCWSDLSARMEMKSCIVNQLLNRVIFQESNIGQFDPESSKVLLKNEISTSYGI